MTETIKVLDQEPQETLSTSQLETCHNWVEVFKNACCQSKATERQKARKILTSAVVPDDAEETAVRMFANREGSVQKWTLETLQVLPQQLPFLADVIIPDAFISAKKDVIKEALDCLLFMKEEAKESTWAQKIVRLACTHDKSDVRKKATSTIKELGFSSELVAEALVRFSLSTHLTHAHNANTVVATIDDGNKLIQSFLAQLMKKPLGKRIQVCASLCKLGAREAVLPQLMKDFREVTLEKHKKYIIETLGEIGECSEEVVMNLRMYLADDSVDLRTQAAKSLGQLGEEASDAVGDLVDLLKDQSSRVRSATAKAIGRMGSKGVTASGALCKALHQAKEWEVRQDIVEAFSAINVEAKPVVNLMLENLQDTNGEVRRSVMRSLAKVEPPRDLPPVMKKAFSSSFKDVRIFAVRYCGSHYVEQISVKNALAKFRVSTDGEEVGVAKWVDSYHQEKAANAASETVEQADPN